MGRPLAFIHSCEFILDVVEFGQVPVLKVVRILDNDDILAREWLIRHQVFPELCFDVESFYCLVRIHIP